MTKRLRNVLVLAVVLSLAVSLISVPANAAVIRAVDFGAEPVYQTFLRVVSTIKAIYVEDVPFDRLLRGAIRGSLARLDPYSVYFTKEELNSFMESTVDGEFGGIGANIESKDGYITVVSPLRGSPAERAGLKTGDRILEVDGKPILKVATEVASSLIRGPAGTKVKLKIQRGSETLEIVITRALIKLNAVSGYTVLDGQLGIIRLERFTESAGQEVTAIVKSMKALGVKGFVLDLRNNPGGVMSAATDALNSMMPRGVALHVQERDGALQPIYAGTEEPLLPIVLLINGGSASASEIVAGALKDHGTAYVMGEKSFGKGSIQRIFDFPDGDGMKITVAKYLTPFKNTIDGVGVTPDQVVPASWDNPKNAPGAVEGKDLMTGAKLQIGGADRQMHEAIEMLKLKARVGW